MLSRSIQQITKEVYKYKNQLRDIGNSTFPTAQAAKFEEKIQKAEEKVNTLKQKLSEIGSVRTETKAFQNISQQLDAAYQKIDAFYEKADELIQGLGFSEDTDPLSVMPEKAKKEFQAACEQADRLQELYDKMRADGSAWQNGTDTKEYQTTAEQLHTAEAELQTQTDAYNNAKAKFDASKEESYAQTATNLSEAQMELRSMTDELSRTQAQTAAFNNIKENSAKAFSHIKNGAKEAWKIIKKGAEEAWKGISKIGDAAKSAGHKLASMAVGGFKNLTGIGKHSKSANNAIEALTKRIWGLAKRVFIFSMITKGLRAIRSAFSEGMKMYLGWDNALNQQVQNLKNSVQTLKASFGGAFAPIVQAAVPALQTLVNWLIMGVNAMGAFIAAITGKSTYKSVVATTAAAGQDAAQSVNDATDAVKDLKKELSNYDELNVITDNSTSGNNGGGGTGSGGNSGTGIQYQDTAIDNAIKDFANKLKKAWEEADFYDIGRIIGEKLNDGLNSINWEKIKATAGKIGKSLATFINGFVEVEGLGYNIGRTIAEAINTGLTFVEQFVKNLHFASIGKFIADGINGLLDTIEWEKAYSTARYFGKGIADLLNEAFNPITSNKVGHAVANGLNTILLAFNRFSTSFEWENFGKTLSSGLSGFLTKFRWELAAHTFTNLLNGIKTSINSALADFGSRGGFEFVGKKVGGFIKSVLLNNDWQLTADNFNRLAKGIVGSIKSAIEEFARNDGFYKVGIAIGSAIQKIDFSAIFDMVAETIWDALNGAIDLAKGLFKGTPFETAFNKIDEFAKKIDFETLKDGLKGILDVGLKFTGGFLSGLVTAISKLAEIGWGVITFIGKALGFMGDELSKLDPDFVQKIGFALGIVAVALAAILAVAKVQTVITGIAVALGITGPAGAAAAAGMGAASTQAGLLATAFGDLKAVGGVIVSVFGKLKAAATPIFEAGGILPVGIVAALELGKAMQILDEKTRGENGKLSELGGFMQSIATKFSPSMETAIRKNVDELENADASTDEWAAALAELFKANKVNPEKLKNAFGEVGGEINITTEQQKLFNKVLELMGPKAEKAAKAVDLTKEEYSKLDKMLWNVANSAGLGTQAKEQFDYVLSQNKGAGSAKQVIDALAQSMEDMGISSDDFVSQCITEFPNAFKSIETGAKNADEKTGTFSSTFAKFIAGTAVQVLSMLGIGTSYDTIKDKAEKAINPIEAVWESLKKAPTESAMKTNGTNAASGYLQGYETEMKKGPGIATNSVRSMDKAVETEEQMHSPSKKWEGYGKNLVAGMIRGLSEATETLKVAVKSILDTAKRTVTGYGDIVFKLKPEVLKIPQAEIKKIKTQLENETWNITLTAKKIKDMVPLSEKFVDRITAKVTKAEDKTSGSDKIKVHGSVSKALDATTGRDAIRVTGSVQDIIDRLSWNQKRLNKFMAYITSYDDYVSGKRIISYFQGWITSYADKIPSIYKVLTNFQAWISSAVSKKAKGGVFSNGTWKDLPQYATGGRPTHGTAFIAGENGAEVVGTYGGRTEVLNRSQIAMAIYSAVKAAMQGFGNGISEQLAYNADYIGYHLDHIPEKIKSYIPDITQTARANYAYTTAGIDYNKLADALQNRTYSDGGAQYTFTANLDGREIFRETVNQNELYKNQTGRSAF